MASKQAIEKGYAGNVYHARAVWTRTRAVPIGTGWFTDREKSGGGALIDLGSVTRLEDPDPVVYGTEGYEAPEVPSQGPSVAADLYSLARCLLVLVLNLPTYQTAHRHELPSADQEPLFRQHESFHRCCHKHQRSRTNCCRKWSPRPAKNARFAGNTT